MRRVRFLIGLSFVILSAVLQVRLDEVGYSLEFVLAALTTLAVFLAFEEVLALGLFGAWILNWQPLPSREIFLLFLLPALFFFIERASSWRPWIINFVSTFFAVTLFYVFSNHRAVFQESGALLENALTSAIFGAIIFHAMGHYYDTESARFRKPR